MVDQCAEVLDLDLLDELKMLADDDDPEFLSELIETYLSELDPSLEAMAQAAGSNDPEAVRRAAHRLKGSSANIGASELSARCAELEQRHRQSDAHGELLAAVDAEAARVRVALRGYLSEA